MTSGPPRSPHAALAKDGRYRKGRKIEMLLELVPNSSPRRLLEIGTGSGWISHYFAHNMAGQYDVDAVDVVDNRQSKEGYRFTLVADTALPFADGTFDVVISNHVIEHVGDDYAQARHLAEMRRVLRPGGIGYLAVPNRWMLVEPHYRLAFLSWWPEHWRSRWLRLWRKGRNYDCRPLSRGGLERRFTAIGLRFQQVHGEAVRALFEIERPQAVMWERFLKHVPDRFYSLAGAAFPTLIYRVWRH